MYCRACLNKLFSSSNIVCMYLYWLSACAVKTTSSIMASISSMKIYAPREVHGWSVKG